MYFCASRKSIEGEDGRPIEREDEDWRLGEVGLGGGVPDRPISAAKLGLGFKDQVISTLPKVVANVLARCWLTVVVTSYWRERILACSIINPTSKMSLLCEMGLKEVS
jgi:hypothetical protein